MDYAQNIIGEYYVIEQRNQGTMKNSEDFKIKRKTDWTSILVQVGLWGFAVLLSVPYIIGYLK